MQAAIALHTPRYVKMN